MMEALPVRTDPIESEPLHHFHPGSLVLRSNRLPADLGVLVDAAVRAGAGSVAIPADVSPVRELARVAGLRDVTLVSSSTIGALESHFPTPRWVDAPVVQVALPDVASTSQALDEVARLMLEDVWVELECTLFGEADGERAIDALTRRFVAELGPDVPLHLQLLGDDEPSRERGRHARWIAAANGLHWVYGGDRRNDRDVSSWCPGCDGLLANRRGGPRLLQECPTCGWPIPGRFARDARRRSSTSVRRVTVPALKRTAT
jgi:hypothetical protein